MLLVLLKHITTAINTHLMHMQDMSITINVLKLNYANVKKLFYINFLKFQHIEHDMGSGRTYLCTDIESPWIFNTDYMNKSNAF